VAVPNFLVTFRIPFVLFRCQCEMENTSKYGTECKNESPRLFYGQFCSIGWPRKTAKSDRVTSSVPHFRFPTPISASVRLTGRSSLTFIQRILFSGGGNQCNCYCFLPPRPPRSLLPLIHFVLLSFCCSVELLQIGKVTACDNLLKAFEFQIDLAKVGKGKARPSIYIFI